MKQSLSKYRLVYEPTPYKRGKKLHIWVTKKQTSLARELVMLFWAAVLVLFRVVRFIFKQGKVLASRRPPKKFIRWLKQPHTLEVKIKNFTLKLTIILLVVLLAISWLDRPKVIYADSMGLKEAYKAIHVQDAQSHPEPSLVPLPYLMPYRPKNAAVTSCEALRTKLSAYLSGTELNAAVTLAQKESNCQSTARNPSSGACNVFQELPCGKWGGYNTDAHIQGAIRYARDKYGSFVNALAVWNSRNPHWW